MVRLPGNKNVFGLMPCAVTLEDGMFFGIKVLSVFFTNMGTSYSSHQGTVLLFEGQHGQMVAMADAHSVTQIRTAAVSGLATQYCARSDDGGQNPLVCAILGAGVQAESHIEAVSCVRKLSKVRFNFLYLRNGTIVANLSS
jgi:ornithine cyclodeaminase